MVDERVRPARVGDELACAWSRRHPLDVPVSSRTASAQQGRRGPRPLPGVPFAAAPASLLSPPDEQPAAQWLRPCPRRTGRQRSRRGGFQLRGRGPRWSGDAGTAIEVRRAQLRADGAVPAAHQRFSACARAVAGRRCRCSRRPAGARLVECIEHAVRPVGILGARLKSNEFTSAEASRSMSALLGRLRARPRRPTAGLSLSALQDAPSPLAPLGQSSRRTTQTKKGFPVPVSSWIPACVGGVPSSIDSPRGGGEGPSTATRSTWPTRRRVQDHRQQRGHDHVRVAGRRRGRAVEVTRDAARDPARAANGCCGCGQVEIVECGAGAGLMRRPTMKSRLDLFLPLRSLAADRLRERDIRHALLLLRTRGQAPGAHPRAPCLCCEERAASRGLPHPHFARRGRNDLRRPAAPSRLQRQAASMHAEGALPGRRRRQLSARSRRTGASAEVAATPSRSAFADLLSLVRRILPSQSRVASRLPELRVLWRVCRAPGRPARVEPAASTPRSISSENSSSTASTSPMSPTARRSSPSRAAAAATCFE